jgi:hypothetical protein
MHNRWNFIGTSRFPAETGRTFPIFYFRENTRNSGEKFPFE